MNNKGKFYVVDHCHKIKRGKIYTKKILDLSILLWRKSDGILVAQSKFCTHLGASLNKGKLINDKLVCPFHGFKFNEKGESNRGLAQLKTYNVIEKMGFIFINIGNNNVENNFLDFIPDIDMSKYEIIPCYDKIYNLPSDLCSSNFFDLNHFSHIHGLDITKFELLKNKDFFQYRSIGLYKPKYYFQKIFFHFFPNKVKNDIRYKNNFIYSKHTNLNSNGKIIFEYYGLFPSTPIGKDKTLIISSIIVKKGLLSFLARLYGKNILFKETDKEFSMLEGGNYNIKNYIKGDELLKEFLDYYGNENK